MNKGLECLQQIKNEYNACELYNIFGISKENSHYEQFKYLFTLLKDDEYAKQIILTISSNYNFHNSNRKKCNEQNVNNPFYLLEQKIKEKENDYD